MFSLRAFIKKGLLDAVGKQPDYWVILNAAGWMEKGVLTEEDLAEIQAAMEARAQQLVTAQEAEEVSVEESAQETEETGAEGTAAAAEDGSGADGGETDDVPGD